MSVSGAVVDSEPSTTTRIAEIFFLDRVPAFLRLISPILAVLLAGLAAVALERMHRTFEASAAAGDSLNPISTLLANGSSAATVWPGWVAAAFFTFALFRLRHGPAEPPAGRGDADSLSVADLRAGLRAEYASVRAALVVVAGVALTDAARTVIVLASATADGTSAATLIATAAEASGLVAAAALLAAWAWNFRAQLDRWGAM